MILTMAQAQAIYAAMCELNNVGGRLGCEIDVFTHVKEMASGAIYVSHDTRNSGVERHADQAAFAAAYGLE